MTRGDPLSACIDFIEHLCASMRVLGALGPEHPDFAKSVQSMRRAIAAAEPPFSLRFLSDGVLRDRAPLPLTLSAFRRAQIVARTLHQWNTPELRFTETPSPETLHRLTKVMMDSTQGKGRSVAPRLPSLELRPLCRVDPLGRNEESEMDRALRSELHNCARRIERIEQKRSPWPWSEAQQMLAALERCMLLGVSATARAHELSAAEWTTSQRVLASTLQTMIVLGRLRAGDLTRRATCHAMLALCVHNSGFKRSFTEAAERALAALLASVSAASDAPSSPSPHRVRTLAVLAACADPQAPALAAVELLRGVYAVEQRRIEEGRPRRSRLDLQAWLVDALGREIHDGYGRAMLAAVGVLPPGAHVLCGGRLGVVVGAGEEPLEPLVLVGGEVTQPQAAVAPCSPLGMTPWAK